MASDMSDKMDDLRKRVEQSKDCMIAPRWADLIRDLWAWGQEQHVTIERLRAEIELVSK
jgi:hypothetical protein